MAAIDDIHDGNAILEEVEEGYRDIFAEIFLNEDSDDEFLGFDADDIDDDETNVPFEDTWFEGTWSLTISDFEGRKKINTDLNDDVEMVDFVKLFLDDYFLDTLVEETNKYAQDFFVSPQGTNLKPQSRFRKWTDVTETTFGVS